MLQTLQDPIWFAPLNVIHHFSKLDSSISDKERKSKKFRKAQEMLIVSIMLSGLQSLQGVKYWLQLVDDNESSPDVRTGTFVPSEKTNSPGFSIQDIEVVTFEEHSRGSVIDFLGTAKLSGKKSYDEKTTILCEIKQNIHLPPLTQLNDEIKLLRKDLPVMIVGRTSSTKKRYKIAQINPDVDLVYEFDLSVALKTGHTGVLDLRRGTHPVSEYHPDVKHYPFEKLGYVT